ncbi:MULTISPECIES: hypothetical protein [Streptococcus]|jgi:hypothetical protein|uniref:Uncharacterized protein n=3 Tax=Bacteria TaxID=2 RepID=A0A1S0Z7M3_SALET|nr:MULTISPECIES: hypothetical protein [Streptococcus]EKA12023.1 hypothetical protein GMD2S_08594 [Streptococcus sp. GMD2S]EKA05783.1 hypothetical protein GMD6S_07219 [Streptococcus sp. GMD6S]EKA10755.1 hypothetical protein GMD4S_06292 [Streptococcus sp. GMD4S]EKA12560.1 hypothetical protein GMD1S_10455 [Streptococcus sp. GMD1S]MBR8667336.1 hypothetical protein [Streptococcus oralis]
MKKRALILLVLSIVVFGGGAWLAQETNLFLSPRAKQLAYLKEHQKEIEDFVKSKNSKIESVQIDWRQTQWDKVGNGTPQGGGDIIDVYGTFNNIDNSGWHVMIIVDDGKVDLASMTLVNGLGIGGKPFE